MIEFKQALVKKQLYKKATEEGEEELVCFKQIEDMAGVEYLREKYFIGRDKLGN